MIKQSLTHLPIYPENYFLAAHASLLRLCKQFPQIDELMVGKIWKRLDLESYPNCNEPICIKIQYKGLLPEREKRILQFSQFPTAYGVVYSKVETQGAKAFLKNYLRLAIEDPEYLAHRVSILESFYSLWPEVESDTNLRALWSDRLTEFLESSFTKPATQYSLLKMSDVELTKDEIAREILLKPGYNGHHVIALATSFHLQSELLSREFQELQSKLSHLVTLEYEDIDDNVVITQVNQNPTGDISKVVINFLLQGPEDPRTIVLADALITLWNKCDSSLYPLILANFQRFLRH